MQYSREFISEHEDGPTADVTWSGADPTQTLDAVQRAQR